MGSIIGLKIRSYNRLGVREVGRALLVFFPFLAKKVYEAEDTA